MNVKQWIIITLVRTTNSLCLLRMFLHITLPLSVVDFRFHLLNCLNRTRLPYYFKPKTKRKKNRIKDILHSLIFPKNSRKSNDISIDQIICVALLYNILQYYTYWHSSFFLLQYYIWTWNYIKVVPNLNVRARNKRKCNATWFLLNVLWFYLSVSIL